MAERAVAARDVEEVLREGGFTAFHRRIVAVTGLAWTFVAMEILLIGFTLPLFRDLWGLSGAWLGLLGSAALAGSLVGSLAWGRAADRMGRRGIFQATILWYSAFTALTALAWGPGSLLVLRFLAGIGLGGMLVVDPALLTEYLPPQNRGRFLVFLDFFWPIGMLLAIGLSFVFLDLLDGRWRWLFLAAACPAFLAAVTRRAVPESPYFLARAGRRREAAEVLGRITGRAVDAEGLAAPPQPAAPFGELFGPELRRTSALVVVVWIALNISYYALFIWLPDVIGAVQRFGIPVYLLLALAAAAQFPGYAAAIWLVEVWGRKRTLATFLVLGGASAYVFSAARSPGIYLAALFFVGFFNLGAWGAVYPYTSELYPTRLRSSAFGLAEGVGKAAAIAGPYLFGYLRDVTGELVWSLTFVAAVMALGGLVTASLGRETKGAKLT
ncbi:MAG TPA: MFS transporter [Actinomycetota bacterium]|nr:MFS transporter [Actinomycetota bacterium]